MTLAEKVGRVPKKWVKKSPVFSCSGLFQIDHFDKIHGFDDACLMRYLSLLVNFIFIFLMILACDFQIFLLNFGKVLYFTPKIQFRFI